VKRLPDEFEVTDPNEVYAAALLKQVPPLEPSAMRKRRVWMALERSATKRSRARVSGPVVAALVLCGATAASATMPHLWKRWQRGPVEGAAVATVTSESTRIARRAASSLPIAPPALSEPALPTTTLPQPVLPPIEPAPAARKQTPAKARVAVAEPADPPASAALMVEAMRERRAGHLARARELSSEYRLKYPGGALQEEALALSIEAAAALGDDEARRLSALYLQHYPQGRFRAQAQRVMGPSR
jgi:hypothetical protein